MKLFRYEWNSPVAWGISKEDAAQSYFEMYFEFPCLFTVNVANAAFCSLNPIKAILMCIEHLCVKSSKYDALKEQLRQIDHWRYL